MTLIIWIISLALYFGIGYRCAVRNLPRSWRNARKNWTDSVNQKEDVRLGFIMMILFWWIRLPISWIGFRVDQIAIEHDPLEMQKRLNAQQDRIAELERDLGIPSSQ